MSCRFHRCVRSPAERLVRLEGHAMEGEDGPFVYAVHAGSRGGTTDGIGVRGCGGHQYGRRAERFLSRARSWVEHHVDEEVQIGRASWRERGWCDLVDSSTKKVKETNM